MKKIMVMVTKFSKYKDDKDSGGFLYDSVIELKKIGYNVSVLTPHTANSEFKENINGLVVYRFPYFYPFKLEKLAYGSGIPYNLKNSYLAKIQVPLFFLSELLYSIRVIRKEKIEAIQAQGLLPQGLVAILIKKLFKIPVILTVHGSDLRMSPKTISSFVLDNVDAILSPHPELTQIIRSLGRNDITEIPNIIDDDNFNPNIDPSSFKKEFNIKNEYVISFIARLNEFKDPITFVKAVPYVLEKKKDVKFFVVGDGPLKSKINELIKKLNIEEFVTVTGSRNDVNIILRASTIFTALSPIENIWSVVIVEAMKCGVPCIITKSGMTEKYLIHRQHAYLNPPKNERKLANAILYLLEHKELRDKLSKDGIMLMKEMGFLKEDIVRKTLEVYRKIGDEK